MKKKIFINLIVLLSIIIMPISLFAENGVDSKNQANVTFKYNPEEQKEVEGIPEIGCKAAYIAEPITGKVLYEKNSHEKMYPASTTKILTALLALEKCQLTDTAVVSQQAIDIVPEGYSNANLKAGETHTINDLLYALLLPSANEAANVLAEHISGSVEEFAELCNNRAAELGCENLHFTNANGLHDENHYCTAYDLYLIAKECRKYEAFNEIVKTKTYTLPSTDIYPEKRIIKNTNELLYPGLYYYANCTGIKTGYTTPAGECLVASSSYNDLELISVVLGGKSSNNKGLNERFYDTKRLCEFVYDNYSIKEIANNGDHVANLSVGKANNETKALDVIVGNDISTILPNDLNKENLLTNVYINEDIEAPIEQNQVLGHIDYHADGLVYTTDIIASHSVQKLPYTLYNIAVVGIVVLTLGIFIILIKKSKRYKIIIIIIEIAIITGVYIAVSPLVKEYIENTKTIITPVEDKKIEEQDTQDIEIEEEQV